jgi:hypothetical protein
MAPAARAQRRPLLAPYSTCRLRVTKPAARAQRLPPFASPNGACRLLIQQRLPLGPSMMPVTRPSQRRPPCTPHPAPLAVRTVPIDHAVYLRPSHARCALAVQVALSSHSTWFGPCHHSGSRLCVCYPPTLRAICLLCHAARLLSCLPASPLSRQASFVLRSVALAPWLALTIPTSPADGCSGATHDTAEPMNHR